ncbi:E3 ubiquitin-protein ligase BRE1B-like [Apostichopus japonicus]|uniref:E3 ubiquitin-protein ligase BRE1B-like n=1 Tax=Stichopus japonicus TaxID=307972 RepID=UPI003AB59DCD
MASKRPANKNEEGGGEPKAKRFQMEPYNIGPVSSQEELDIKVLQFQNRKLVEKLSVRNEIENELRNQIEVLQQRQATDEAVLSLMNKYWTQLEEDIKIIYKRFEAHPQTIVKAEPTFNLNAKSYQVVDDIKDEEGGEVNEVKQEDEATVKTESSEVVEGNGTEDVVPVAMEMEMSPKEEAGEVKEEDTKWEPEELTSFLTKLSSCDQDEIEAKLADRLAFSKKAVNRLTEMFCKLKEDQEKANLDWKDKAADEILAAVNDGLVAENKKLNQLIKDLQDQHRVITMQVTAQSDKLTVVETKLAESYTVTDNLEYDLKQARQRTYKLEVLLEESYTKLKSASLGCDGDGSSGLSSTQHQSILNDMEEQKSLAESRLLEIEKLQEKYQECLKEAQQMKMDLQLLPEGVVVRTSSYKCIKTQFSILYKEATDIKLQLEEARNLLQQAKKTHMRQIEQMESDELACQKKLRTEMMQLEDNLAQVQKEYEMLRIEFEQNLAANEQAVPINQELRRLLATFQTQNQQLKGEVQRYRRKFKESQVEIQKLKEERNRMNLIPNSAVSPNTTGTLSSSGGSNLGKELPMDHKDPLHDLPTPGKREEHHPHQEERRDREKEKFREDRRESSSSTKSESDAIRDLKASLKKSQESQKEMKLLLDTYKGLAKEQRDKVQMIASEKRIKGELEEAQQRLKYLEDKDRRDSRRLSDDDAVRKIRALEEAVLQLQKKLGEKKQEEEALLAEMEVTGQAFEDMQEQNTRLLQQLREKDEANFKLMAERIKSNQIHKLLQEEKNMMADQVATLQTQVDAQNQVVRKLEEKERILQTSIATMEKDLDLRQQAIEQHKKIAGDCTQETADLKLKLDKIDEKIEELQKLVKEKSSAMEQENHKNRRVQEECQSLRRKVERYKRMELASSADEVLAEEIRTYKEQLTCPCCKKGRKDVVLTKCFHVFCYECIKTRYETRQRKCPKCNAGFGANDYHRIWLD